MAIKFISQPMSKSWRTILRRSQRKMQIKPKNRYLRRFQPGEVVKVGDEM